MYFFSQKIGSDNGCRDKSAARWLEKTYVDFETSILELDVSWSEFREVWQDCEH